MTAVALIENTVVSIDRTGWARRGHVSYDPDLVLSLEVVNNETRAAAQTLDDWAVAAGGEITELQHVFRRGKRVLYGRVTRP